MYAHISRKELAALALQKLQDAKFIDASGRILRDGIEGLPKLPSYSEDDEKE